MEDQKKVTFRQKNQTICPVCSNEFFREEMLTGGGRLIAGALTDELRRKYEASKKFGKIYPLNYQVTVCPICYFAAYPKDFQDLLPDERNKLTEMTGSRKNAMTKFFGHIDFNEDRELKHGAASYMLAVDSYSCRNKNTAPTFKNAVSSIRAAWLFNDLAEETSDETYKKISLFFYKKAYDYYVKVVELVQNGGEPTDAAGNMGPDTDKNWGYEGILYITAVLTMKIGAREKEIGKRIENFERCKRYLSRLFGIGKTSKSKPGELLDKTRDLYDKINEMLEIWKRESGQDSEE
ncbi:MAG TPA: DUF2225 domain-containing protein [Spirochaetota bacterium]|nr:DUF2225 domain-containing protein [Spirochaetota bacterium]HRZ25295.1 DUF2225 domain-containing protein [Spirochaetota bacterium]HSA15020.1 DUF2225 domain-containing protein [Spirochaetota bacterium]